jgi:hypothetical protein
MKNALLLSAFAGMLAVAAQAADDTPPPPQQPRPTLTLAPAVVMAKIKPGQGWTQTLRMSNGTGVPFRFEIEVKDVVVKNGQRTYVPAGETEGGIAAGSVASPRSGWRLPEPIRIVGFLLTNVTGLAIGQR